MKEMTHELECGCKYTIQIYEKVQTPLIQIHYCIAHKRAIELQEIVRRLVIALKAAHPFVKYACLGMAVTNASACEALGILDAALMIAGEKIDDRDE